MEDLDYYVFRSDGQWAWEVVEVDDDGLETSLASGFAPTSSDAQEAAHNAIRAQYAKRGVY